VLLSASRLRGDFAGKGFQFQVSLVLAKWC